MKRVAEEPVSTFSVDVDTASYSFVRRQLHAGRAAAKGRGARRGDDQLLRLLLAGGGFARAAVQAHGGGQRLALGQGPQADAYRHQGLRDAARQQPDVEPGAAAGRQRFDEFAGQTAAGQTVHGAAARQPEAHGHRGHRGVCRRGRQGARPTQVRRQGQDPGGTERLQAGGSTAGAEGIELAYELAETSFRKDGVNRILLATDGDFNVGIDSTEELKGFVERKREKGIFLSVLGFGRGIIETSWPRHWHRTATAWRPTSTR